MLYAVLPTLPTYREIGNTVFFSILSLKLSLATSIRIFRFCHQQRISFISFHTKYSASITKFGKNVVFIIAKTPNHWHRSWNRWFHGSDDGFECSWSWWHYCGSHYPCWRQLFCQRCCEKHGCRYVFLPTPCKSMTIWAIAALAFNWRLLAFYPYCRYLKMFRENRICT